MDASLALLSEHVNSEDLSMRVSAVFGLGLAYAGTGREDVMEFLVPIVVDPSQPFEVRLVRCGAPWPLCIFFASFLFFRWCSAPHPFFHLLCSLSLSLSPHFTSRLWRFQLVAYAALALGLVFTGRANEEISATLVEVGRSCLTALFGVVLASLRSRCPLPATLRF